MNKQAVSTIALLTLTATAVMSCASASADSLPVAGNAPDGLQVATFAGGCFWCMEQPIEEVDGVVDVVSGYTGGVTENPTYGQVVSGSTGHFEAVQVTFDPDTISYETLLGIYWRQIDPTDAGGQFADRGDQYRTAIFYHDETQKKLAEKSRRELERSGRFDKPIATEILPARAFYVAEEYHQDYYAKYPLGYGSYKTGSGRELFLKENWPDIAK